MIEFFVQGQPQPAGSKTAKVLRRGGKVMYNERGAPVVITYDANPDAAAWKKLVGQTCFYTQGGRKLLLTGPLELRVTFVVERPKGHYRTGRFADQLRDDAPSYPVVKPDSTKLLRCVEDGLNGILWRDDAQIVRQRVEKVYGSPAGAIVRVARVLDVEPTLLAEESASPLPAEPLPF